MEIRINNPHLIEYYIFLLHKEIPIKAQYFTSMSECITFNYGGVDYDIQFIRGQILMLPGDTQETFTLENTTQLINYLNYATN